MKSSIVHSSVPSHDAPHFDIGGFAQLSCYAATELDSLLAQPGEGLPNVQRLKEVITDITENADAYLDPATMTVLTWAFTDSNLFQPTATTTIVDLIGEAKKVLVNLEAISTDPRSFRDKHPSEIQTLRDLCLSLSRQASAYEYSLGFEEVSVPERA